MKPIFLALTLIIATFFSVPADRIGAQSQPAPDFAYVDIDGKKHTLAGLKGKVIIINCWATWCPPCKEEIPALAKFQEAYPVAILGVSYDEEVDDIRGFLQSETGKKINYPVIFASSHPNFFGEIGVFPTTFFIDKQGRVRKEHLGLLTYERLEETVKPLLAE